ncbi:MAG: PAS domain S-box protein [bacterium]|nr:PAS domain S-box protein [bacterium]
MVSARLKQNQPISPDSSDPASDHVNAPDSVEQLRATVLANSELLAELDAVRERLAELEDLEVQRITDEQERFDSLNVLDEYAQQLEESRDKLARLLRAGVGIEEARTTRGILQTVADAVGAAGWASAVVYLFESFEVIESAFYGVCDEDIIELERNRRPADERARMFAPTFDEFKVSRSYFVPSQRLHEVIHSRYVVPGRRESMPGDDWDPMDLVYVPMYSSTGKILGTINCDDPVNGKRPNAEVFQYLEIFADLAARKIETVQLLNRQAEIESQLRESEEKYRTIFDRSADGFFLMDDLFRECNDAALKLFSCEHDDVIGHSPAEFSPKFQPDGQRSDKLASEYINRARNGNPQSFEWVHLRKDGAELNCEVSLASIDVSGRSMIMAIVRDITDRKRMAHDKDTTAIASQLFLSARSMDLVYSQLPKILTSRFPLNIAAVELYDQLSDEMVLVGEENTGLPLGFRVPAAMTISGTVVRSGDPVTDAQTGRRPDYAHADLRRIGLQKIICVPLRVRDHVIGVIWLGDTEHVKSSGQAVQDLYQLIVPLNVIANYLAQAIDRQRAEEELFDLKQFFERLLDNLPAQVSVYDTQGRYRYANRASVPDEVMREWVIGQNDDDLQHRLGLSAETGRVRLAAIADALRKRDLVTFEELSRDAGDRERYYLKAISPVFGDTGGVDYIIGYGQDITDTKLWEQEQRLLRQIPADSPYPVLSCDLEGKIRYMNAAAEELVASHGGAVAENILPLDHHAVVAEFVAGEKSRIEKSRSLGDFSAIWTYCRNSYGNIGVYGAILPAHQSKNAPTSSQQAHLADTVTASISLPVWMLDASGNTISSSVAARRLLSELNVDSVRKLMDEDFWTAILSNRGPQREVLGKECQFHSRAWKWTITFTTDQLRLIELQDVTEFRQLQDKLRHAQKLEAVGRLAGGIAHDFNNLLTGIIGNLELLEQAHVSSDHTRDCAREAAKAAERASNLVRQLLNYSRKSADEARSLDPNAVCSSVARMLSRTVDRRISVVEDSCEKVWPISADPNQIEQILMNLGVNAADAILERISVDGSESEPPKISIKTENVKDYNLIGAEGKRLTRDCVAISVIDNGCGMSQQIQKRIFDAFFTTKAENRGTGLGLSIVAELVDDLGGEIDVQSQEGLGTTFRLLIPRTETAISAQIPARTFGNIRGGTETVLLVDDEPVIIDLGKEVLEHAGYTVLTAMDGREAVQIFSENADTVALVIMDISLPVMSGDEAVSMILAEREDTPVILSSGLPDVASERRKISLGSVAFIQKPYRPSELLSAVREVLDHAQQ